MTLKRLLAFIFILLPLFLYGEGPGEDSADLILTNGRVITIDQALPEAEAIAIKGARILALGSNADMQGYTGTSTQMIDLDGKLVIPGFIEGHGHFTGIGQARLNLDLNRAANWDEIVSQVEEAVRDAAPGDWILGRGWHQEKWDGTPEPSVEGLPTHHALSRVSPDNPVLLTHASGHASFANEKAMEIAGITSETPAPEGGEIVVDNEGRPTGMFRETAQRLLRRAVEFAKRSPQEEEAHFRKIVRLATDEVLANGITSFQDAGSSFQTVDGLRRMAESGDLRLRLYVMLREPNSELAGKLSEYRMVGVGDNRLTVRAIKRSIDGALGSHGAWLLEAYSDMPSSTGLNTASIESVTETARLAITNGYQLCVHAIGDRANREVLDIFEKIFQEYPEKDDLRWRIEHAQHLHPDDIPRFAELGVIASMQGIHATSDGPWVYRRLGRERAAQGAYVWQKLLDSGAVVTNGTDAPVEDVSPIASYYATVSRMMKTGERFFPEQRMSREEALRSYTINPAYAAFEEDIKGTLTPGKLADVVVLSKDILTIPEEEILSTRVLYTIVGGKIEYQAPEIPEPESRTGSR